jgi:hypothetical protein
MSGKWHGPAVLFVFRAPYQLRLLAGQEHGRTMPLTAIRNSAPYPIVERA